MSYLEDFIKNCIDTRGLEHKSAIQALRWYIRISKEEEILEAINKIENMEYLRILMEAGLRKPYLEAVVKRYDYLKMKAGGMK